MSCDGKGVVIADSVQPTVVVHNDCNVVLVAPAAQGAPGRPGVPGPDGGSALQRVAGEIVSALHVVYELEGAVFLLDWQDSDHINLALGVALTAADTGEPLNVQRSGAIDEPSWSWAPGLVWLGASGALTQVAPDSGFGLLVGAAVSATRLILNLQQPIEL